MYEAAAHCDKVLLLSGDGDFDLLLQRIRQRFNTVSQVYGVPALTSAQLINEADSRHCLTCHQHVYMCNTLEQVNQRARLGQCIVWNGSSMSAKTNNTAQMIVGEPAGSNYNLSE